MSTRRSSSGDTGNGPHPLVRRPKRFGLLAVFAVAFLVLANVADAGKGNRRNRDAAPPPEQAAKAAALTLPTTLTKSLAIDAVIQALAMNHSAASEKTLEQIVTGEIVFGGHGKQAAQSAMLLFALGPSPPAEAFLLRIFTDPDEAIRPGDQGVYPATELRADTAHVLAKVGSPHLRLELAKVYTQSATPPAVRSAIEEMIRTPATANFAAQVEVFRSAEAPDALKEALQTILFEKNVSAIKLALRLEGDASSPAAAAGGSPFSASAGVSSDAGDPAAVFANAAKMLRPGAMPGLSPATTTSQKGNVAAGAAAAKPGAALSSASTPAMMMLDMVSQIQSRQPIDAGLVARNLWKPDFVETISKKLADDKGDETELVNALASLPTKSARDKLKDVLHKDRTKGPQDLGKVETVTATAAAPVAPAAAAPTRHHMGKHKKDEEGAFGGNEVQEKPRGTRFGLGSNNPGQAQPKQQVVEFGKDWFDPGSLVVLKTAVPYQERPPEKAVHRPMYQPTRVSPAMEKRLRERAEKKKALESTYDWRDAVEKAVRAWDDRLSAVAEAPSEPQGAAENSSGSDEKVASGAAKTGKTSSEASSKTSPSAATKTPAANPSVAMLFAMHTGGTIAKEYHLRWPQDAAASLGSAVTEPLAVDYVRLQGTGDIGKALTHYRVAISAVAAAKSRITLRSIENGKWLDTVQTDQAAHRTRSIDVLVTRESSDDDNGKKSKDGQMTVEILVVEIETPGSDATPGNSKKEARETTSTTTP
jgi:hypothetical protein